MTEHNEQHRQLRRDAGLLIVAETNALRRRIEIIEERLHIEPERGYLDSWAKERRDALDPDDFADEAARSWDALAAVLPVEP